MRAKARSLRFAVALAAVAAVAGAAGAPAALGWGGVYPTSTGENVRVTVSDRYPVDETMARGWAEYLASLLHGPELVRVTLYLAPYSEVQALCGFDALACYSGQRELIVAPREDFPEGPTAQAVVAHEYGHHVAANRLNPPWDASGYGTKRWASRIGVCAKTEALTLFPGADGPRAPSGSPLPSTARSGSRSGRLRRCASGSCSTTRAARRRWQQAEGGYRQW